MKNEKLTEEELEKVTGAALYPDGIGSSCKHIHKHRTGAEREDSRFIFFSQHQYQYFCDDCQKYVWIDEER